jgi:hypothetical protein
MNPEVIRQRKEDRQTVLAACYEIGDGSTDTGFDVDEVVKVTGLDRERAASAVAYLCDAGLIRQQKVCFYVLTPEGVDAVEQSIQHSTFPQVTLGVQQVYNGPIGAVQNGPGAVANVVQQTGEPVSGASRSLSDRKVLRFLHISDLHERTAFADMPEDRQAKLDWDARERGVVLGDKFYESLRELRKEGIDFVCVTGDVADWGHPAEYRAATDRLRRMLEAVGVPPTKLFVIPASFTNPSIGPA